MTEFPARMAGMGRYHLLLATSLRPVQQGWWGSEAVARDKFRRWIGEYGDMPGARLVLTDEETCEVLAAWPAHG
ncbi:hypothetical protein [Streptomyces griseofuscus]|uniref:Uncharacterized protein n=1 Tax=Streptomyces griseofuscus TaxID=146922 RepID=A0A7H1QD75_9ACTN|nr:hypothetical protein [Streptomyces griseofuscus]QNT98255.1 hypothetical protein HEP81_08027 [Streptomyces griseofuscus]